MTTVSAFIDDVLEDLRSVRREERTTLNAALDDSETTVTIATDSDGLDAGSYIEVDDELLYVVVAEGRSAVVIRGADGSTAASHSSGATVTINPRFPRAHLMARIAPEIQSWEPSRVFKVATATVSFAANAVEADLDGASGEEVMRILSAYRTPSYTGVPRLSVRDLSLLRDQDTSVFTSGYAVQRMNRWAEPRTVSVRVTYAAKYNVAESDVSSGSVDINDTDTGLGIPERLNTLLRYGVAYRAMNMREVARSDLQAQGSSSEEVPVTYLNNVAANIRGLREMELVNEQLFLQGKYPNMVGA